MAERRFKPATDPCSFCGAPAAQRKAMAGTSWAAVQICDECLGLCYAILAQDVLGENVPDISSKDIPLDTLESLITRVEEAARSAPPLALEGKMRFDCSFCGATRKDVAKLISGPRVFICETCVAEAIRFTQR